MYTTEIYLKPNKLQICINYKNNEIHIHLGIKYQWKHITLLYSSCSSINNYYTALLEKIQLVVSRLLAGDNQLSADTSKKNHYILVIYPGLNMLRYECDNYSF